MAITIVDKLEQFRQERHLAAQCTYSEILQRYDAPKPGDAEALDKAMVELKIDPHHLEHDIHLIQRYRAYEQARQNAPTPQEREQARRDADGIRKGSATLFLASEDHAAAEQNKSEENKPK